MPLHGVKTWNLASKERIYIAPETYAFASQTDNSLLDSCSLFHLCILQLYHLNFYPYQFNSFLPSKLSKSYTAAVQSVIAAAVRFN